MVDKDLTVRKARAEVDKVKKAKEVLEHRLPTMEHNIDDLKNLVEKFSSESQKEIKKREVAEKRQDQLQEKLAAWNEVHNELQIEDPIKFKEDFDFVKAELTKLKKQMTDKQKTNDVKEHKLKLKEEEWKSQQVKIAAALKALHAWVPDNLNFTSIKKLNRASDKDRERELSKRIFSSDMELRDKDSASHHLEFLCFMLQESLMRSRQNLQSNSQKILQKHKVLSSEIKDG